MRSLLTHLKRGYSTCQGSLVKPLNSDPIGYLILPGLVKYETALQLQSHLVSRRHQITQKTLETSEPADLICFLEHPPTFTAGRRLRGKSELEEEHRLKHLGADYFETMRGGQITYHGPGQLIAYPILDIRDYQVREKNRKEKGIPEKHCFVGGSFMNRLSNVSEKLNVRCYVSRLEKTIIDCCAKYNIKANTTENTGVWVGDNDKIAALGVHLQRYVSSHGLALNCNTDLSWFDQIVPCGLAEKNVTSITKETNITTKPVDVIPNLVDSFERLFSKQLTPVHLENILSKQVINDLSLELN